VSKSLALFRKTRILENQIDEFLDCITKSGLIFQGAIKTYLANGVCDDFDASTKQANEIETRGDDLRRTIEAQLYEQTLIPDLRADVLRLLEDLDNLINITQANCYRFAVEAPEIPEEYHAEFLHLTETVVACVDAVVMSSRAFFRNIEAVRDHNSKVMFYETEADKISSKLKVMAFSSDLPKVEKIHLRYFIERIDELANEAEDIADALAIYTIKRSI
jgi:hypothetical protein|tara:strand:+ start:1246 stop:1902 length:657 start_codon:yes stop_codon:yes gene_type:complete